MNIRELIMCPLVKCYPADKMPKKTKGHPDGQARRVCESRRQYKRWQNGTQHV